MTWTSSRRPASVETGVSCPVCRAGPLISRFSCLQTHFSCGRCGRRFALADLVPLLGDAEFERLAASVDSRPSDRVW